MSDFFYKTNLPVLKNVLKKNFSFPDLNKSKSGIFRLSAFDVFSLDFLSNLKFKKIDPRIAVLFYTPANHKGSAHLDGDSAFTGPWSLNWNLGSRCSMSWYQTDVTNQGNANYKIFENQRLEKLVTAEITGPCLIRTDQIHSIDNLEDCDRWAVTLRGHPKDSWDACVNFFKKTEIIV